MSAETLHTLDEHNTNQPVESQEETPTNEVTPENQEYSRHEEVAREAQDQETETTIKKLNLSLILDILRLSINQDGTEDPDVSELARKHLAEHNEENLEIDEETIQGLIKLLIELPAKIKSEVELTEEKQNEIIEHICTPVLLGHLSAADVLTMVDSVNISSSNQDSSAQGYEGYMFYNPEERSITISSEIIDGYLTTTGEDGKEMKIKLDTEHMMVHELAHGVTEYTMAKAEQSPEDSDLDPKRAGEVVRKTSELAGSQTFHIESVLAGMSESKIAENHKEAVSNGSSISLEDFRERRTQLAAKEIITDYTAIFLQSDGSFLDFVKTCIGTTDLDKLGEFLNEDVGEDENLDEIYESILDSPEEMNSRPRIKSHIENYRHFYNLINNSLTKNEIADNFDELSLDDYDETDLSLGRGLDRTSNFGAQADRSPENDSLANSIKSLASAFGDEVNIFQ